MSFEKGNDGIRFSGQLPFMGDGKSSAQMMYPANTAATFAAALLTHAAIASSVNENKKSVAQLEADEVLVEYLDAINLVDTTALAEYSLSDPTLLSQLQIGSYYDAPEGIASLDLKVEPLFVLSQDRRSMIVENRVSLVDPAENDAILYNNTISVLNNALTPERPEGAGPLTQQEFAFLAREGFVESLRIFANETLLSQRAQQGAMERTFRYQQGTIVRYERGQLVSQTSQRTVIRTLRGELFSFPADEDFRAR